MFLEISSLSACFRLISLQLRFSLRIHQQGLCSMTDHHTVTKEETRKGIHKYEQYKSDKMDQ